MPSIARRPTLNRSWQLESMPARPHAASRACHCGAWHGASLSQSNCQGRRRSPHTSSSIAAGTSQVGSHSRSPQGAQGLQVNPPTDKTRPTRVSTRGNAASQRWPSSTTTARKVASGQNCSTHCATGSAWSKGESTVLRCQRSSHATADARNSSIDVSRWVCSGLIGRLLKSGLLQGWHADCRATHCVGAVQPPVGQIATNGRNIRPKRTQGQPAEGVKKCHTCAMPHDELQAEPSGVIFGAFVILCVGQRLTRKATSIANRRTTTRIRCNFDDAGN